ncbi:MAG: ribosomal L7Ae/L30e/S12e/Gadd45 family protein [Clostridia bacterium]|nr:ribosomal L7Ae/L30e/S12e/Gadd45 family protein [Clostridia bacterium]
MTPISGLLGLCSRSGQITLGADLALREIKAGRAALALLDEGASPGTRKKITDACAYRGVPLHMLPEGELSRACGKDDRMAAAVKDGKLCRRMLQLLSEPDRPAR